MGYILDGLTPEPAEPSPPPRPGLLDDRPGLPPPLNAAPIADGSDDDAAPGGGEEDDEKGTKAADWPDSDSEIVESPVVTPWP